MFVRGVVVAGDRQCAGLGARHDLAVLRSQNARLQKEAALLNTDAEVERLARSQYHMVRKGEKAYAVIVAAPTTTTTAP